MKTLYSLVVTAILPALLTFSSYGQSSITDQQKLEYMKQIEQAKTEVSGKASGGYSEALECFTNSIFSRPSTNFSSAYTSAEGPGLKVYTNFSGLTSPISGKLRFWGLRLYNSGTWYQCNTEPMPFEIAFHTNNSGLPGAEIISYLVDALAVATGETLAGFPVWEWEVDIPINLNLPNGWISIQSRQSAGNCWFLWLNAPDATNGIACRWNGSAWEPFPAATGFCIGTSPVLTDDVGVSAILSPESGSNLGMEDVTVRVYNYGTAVQNVIPVFFTLDGGTPFYEVITTPIQAGQYIDYTFNTQVDLSAYGIYQIESCTNLAGDINLSNNCNSKLVENFSPSLCTPVYSAGCSYGDGFTLFDIDNQINNATGCDNLNGTGWSQYLGLPPAFLEPGMTYDFTMSTGYSNNNATVWIDFNDDLAFGQDEKVIDCANMAQAAQVYSFPGTIPAQAQTGQHLMRARTNWIQCADDPCTQYVYGEAEDYYVLIGTTKGNLEGYVYEYGTTVPVAGALVELTGSGFSALSDNNGFYSIPDIPAGFYDAVVTHPDYCQADYPGIEIIAGNTTLQNFELTWAEIATNPEQELSVAIPGNTVMPTQIEIINNGTCDLVYDIVITELTETFGGPAPGNDEVVASGKAIPLTQVKGVPVSVDFSVTDAGMPFESGLSFTYPELRDGEEIFGSAQNVYGSLPRTRGNFYEVTTTTTLTEHRLWLNAAATTNMLFCVWESPSKEGTYNLISAADVSPQGPGGPGWYSSGTVNVTLQAGYYYIIAAAWDGNLNYYNDQNISPYPIPASFGYLIEGCGWNWSPPIGYPPAAAFSVSGLLGAPVAYYQTIVTAAPLDWFKLDWYSGTVAPGATEVIPGEFNSTGYSLGTIKTADLAITSNAHPGKTETHLDVIMEVATCTPTYSAGCTYGDGLTYFDIDGQYNNTTGCENNAGTGWSQYPGMNATLVPGSTYVVTASTGYSNQNLTIWIDFNDDFVLEADEVILNCANLPTAGPNFTFNTTIPAGAPAGPHFLRAMANWQPTDPCPFDPCGSFTYGETEDYMVTIEIIVPEGNLEGYVLETGTGVPVEGATVKILGGQPLWTATTDNNGYYLISGIEAGTWDIETSHPSYCPTFNTGIIIEDGLTTSLDIYLTWAEIATSPELEISVVIPENTIKPTQLAITNHGSCDLVYDIEITEISETFGGPAPENNEVIARGKEIPLDEVTAVPATLNKNALDAGMPFITNPFTGMPVPSDGEEIFGSAQNTYGPLPRTRGNFYEVTASTTLKEHRFWLNATASTNMLFCVWESPDKEGTYTLISASDVSPQGPGGPGWFSSGPVNVALQAGYYYIIAAAWDGNLNYYNQQNISPYPIPASFGYLIEACGWNWAPPIGYPPTATQNVSGLLGAPVAYYQTIITNSAPDWFGLDWYSGTVAPGATVTIPAHFNSSGYPLGTLKTAELKITSNAHPSKTETLLDVSMLVDEGFNLDLKVFLEGPFDPGTGFMNAWLNIFGYIPLNQPYNPALPYYGNSNPVWLYNGTETATAIPAGVVDWILLDIRDAANASSAVNSTSVEKIPAFLKFDGYVTGLDGASLPKFANPIQSGLFVVVYHRNHLGIINPAPLVDAGNNTYSWDYSGGANQVYLGTLGHVELAPGIWGMTAGDGNADRQINNQDKMDVWTIDAAQSGYLGGDFSLNGTCNNEDKNDTWAPNVGKGSQVPAF
ncbi:MAG: carboxypeptidase regulatory-like domain-containing protein [Bacteroidales bacterium]|nr:carboxypeptidase regulatory-like domain-containing protein [Bacteroidales bacterium]